MNSNFMLNIDEKIRDILANNISDVIFQTGFAKKNIYQNKKTPIVIIYLDSAFVKHHYLDISGNNQQINRPKKVEISIGFIIYVDKNDESSICMDIFDKIYEVLSNDKIFLFQEFSCSDINFDSDNRLFFLNAKGKIQDIIYKGM